MQKKNIVITGGSSGIGREIALGLAEDGHDLFICGRKSDRLSTLLKHPSVKRVVSCDVAFEEDVRGFFSQVRAMAPVIDAVIHSAGILGPVGPAIQAKSSAWWNAMRVNVMGAMHVVKYATPLLLASQNHPRIILMSGGGAFDPSPYLSAYGASKAAITRIGETLAIELGPQIAVNLLAPGFVPTQMVQPIFDAGRAAGETHAKITAHLAAWKADNISAPVDCARFLISDKANGLTGKTISARHDPWRNPAFAENIGYLNRSRAYSTDRVK